MKNLSKNILVLTLVIAIASACTSTSQTKAGKDATPEQVNLVAYDAFTPTEGIFDDFTATTGATVKILTSGDSGTLVNKAILTTGNPEGDVLWGLDNTMLSAAQDADVLEKYLPVDEGDVCINLDKDWFAKNKVTPPTTLQELSQPEYKNLLVVQDPLASSPGLAFLLATIAAFPNGWQGYWKQLKLNGVHIAADWTTAYTVDFSGSSGKGKYPMVVSYGSSPPAEVLYAATPITEPPTSVMESSCFRQTEYVGVLRGAKNPNLGQKLVDYLLDKKFQESMPLSLFVFPVNESAVLPELFQKFAIKAKNPLTLAPQTIASSRNSWLTAWREIML